MSSLWTLIWAVLALHALAFLVDRVFHGSRGYECFLHFTGLEPPRPVQLKWTTQRLNRIFSRIGTWRPRLLKAWFSLGAVVSILLVLPSMVLLVKTLFGALLPKDTAGTEGSQDRVVLQPVLPGVNLPLSELGYYFVTLLVCSVIHEAGHAVSAASEDVRILGFGTFVLFVVPAAFVDLPTDQLLALRPWQQVRVFAAGIWHNVVLAAFAYLVLFSTPAVASWLYRTGEGVVVVSVRPDSSVTGPTGLVPGDKISLMNGCSVTGMDSWRGCLTKVLQDATMGVCLSKDFVTERKPGKELTTPKTSSSGEVTECCTEEESKSSLCFEEVGDRYQDTSSDTMPKSSWTCLPVRAALEKSEGRHCNSSSHRCSDKEVCMKPSLQDHSRLLRMRRQHGAGDFLFVGSPAEVYQSVVVSPYMPEEGSLLSPWLPGSVELLSHYVVSFSGALAVLNVVPCFFLDGHHLARALSELVLVGRGADALRATVTLTFTVVGTALLVANIAVGVFQLL